MLSPGTRVLALSAYEDRATVLEMLRVGAVGYLVKGTAPDDIVQAIERAARGQTSLSTEVMGGVVQELTTQLERQEMAAEEHRARVERIRRLVTGEGLTIVFQPIFELRGREVVGLEALARFAPDHPSPATVFFEATEAGLRVDLELTAMAMALPHLNLIPPDAYLSLNLAHATALSPRSLKLLDGWPMDRLVLEITEHEPVENYEELLGALDGFRKGGARIAIDDAGAGFASLRHGQGFFLARPAPLS